MNAEDFILNYPNKPSHERDEYTLSAIGDCLQFYWLPVESSWNGHKAIFQVCDDALRVEVDGKRFRPQGNARLLQKVADLIGGCLMTSKVMDMSYAQAGKKINCSNLKAGPLMDTRLYSIEYNEKVEEKRNGFAGLIRDVGKTWLVDNAIEQSAGAINYGFYSSEGLSVSLAGQKMWQTVGTRHDGVHEDYSQIILLMSAYCMLDGVWAKVEDIMKDSTLCGLLSYSGVIRKTRQII